MRPPPLRPRLICVGRLSEQKAQLVLVAAVRRLRDAGIYCEIVLVGDGPMRHQIEDAISRAGLQNEITITGWASGDRIKTEIANARALVLPSFAENMPVVIMEAFAIGRPVISTYVAGIPELVQPGQSGWLVPAADEVALAGAIREALDASVEQLATMGAVGRAHVVEHHDCIKEAMKLKALFEQQLHTSNSAIHAQNAKWLKLSGEFPTVVARLSTRANAPQMRLRVPAPIRDRLRSRSKSRPNVGRGGEILYRTIDSA